ANLRSPGGLVPATEPVAIKRAGLARGRFLDPLLGVFVLVPAGQGHPRHGRLDVLTVRIGHILDLERVACLAGETDTLVADPLVPRIIEADVVNPIPIALGF